ncbi:pirin family protein [Nitrosomonas aestuarii]|uniref:pirin family protein n=1 Tax=Nitrosomonas aestuarii TaxID=52441 RepID=UPI000D31BECA|nr:pirin family protein [Nitrosomonas aestuarii]PTN11992.1 hypothetical protein C8R11_106131 [Nitrosomonas aestuarii]
MDKSTHNTRFIPATATREGAGVTVFRTIGTPALRNYDPFLMLDHISSNNPADYIAGFPSHPHRGFITFTYMLDGQMIHQDSMGNTGNLGPGSAQWMKAASGIIHSEMPKQENSLLRGFQLWINLPAAHKMDRPEYLEYAASAFPVVNTSDYTLKVLIGNYADTFAPIRDDITEVSFFDVQVLPGRSFQLHAPTKCSGFLYPYEGAGQLNGSNVASQTLVIADIEDNPVEFTAGSQGARFLAVHGKPIDEPIVQYGPFVMNTREEIEQAKKDYESNQFVRDQAWIYQGK